MAAIFRCIEMLRESEAGSSSRAEIREVLQWVLTRIRLPGEDKTEINKLLDAHP